MWVWFARYVKLGSTGLSGCAGDPGGFTIRATDTVTSLRLGLLPGMVRSGERRRGAERSSGSAKSTAPRHDVTKTWACSPYRRQRHGEERVVQLASKRAGVSVRLGRPLAEVGPASLLLAASVLVTVASLPEESAVGGAWYLSMWLLLTPTFAPDRIAIAQRLSSGER